VPFSEDAVPKSDILELPQLRGDCLDQKIKNPEFGGGFPKN
jgi:hypothetical protein